MEDGAAVDPLLEPYREHLEDLVRNLVVTAEEAEIMAGFPLAALAKALLFIRALPSHNEGEDRWRETGLWAERLGEEWGQPAKLVGWAILVYPTPPKKLRTFDDGPAQPELGLTGGVDRTERGDAGARRRKGKSK